MAGALELKLKNDLDEIRRMGEAVSRFCFAHGLGESWAVKLTLVLEELISNVIKYGYDDAAEHRIAVSLRLFRNEITVVCEDDGRAFNPFDAPEPDFDLPIEERRVGGLGVHLVKAIMDKVDYSRVDNRNRLVMVKTLI